MNDQLVTDRTIVAEMATANGRQKERNGETLSRLVYDSQAPEIFTDHGPRISRTGLNTGFGHNLS